MMIRIAALLLLAAAVQDKDDPKARQNRINELRKQAHALDEAERLKAVAELGGIVDEDARAVLSKKLLEDTDPVKLAAAKAIIRHRKPICAQALGAAIQANLKSDALCKAFIEALGELDMCASIPVLQAAIESRPASGAAALEQLVKIGCYEAVPPLVNFLKRAETEERKPDFFDNSQAYVQGQGGARRPPPPGTPDKIENKTKDKAVAALAPKVRETLSKIAGKSFKDYPEWFKNYQALTPRQVGVYLCETSGQTFEAPPGKSKKCPSGGDARSDHKDDFLKHRRE
jgi:hypothetical protein